MPNTADSNTEKTKEEAFTLARYLKSKVAVNVPDDTITAILAENGVDEDALFIGTTEKQRDLCLAGLYVFISGSPTTTEKVSDSDADWSHSEGGQMMSANVLNNYLRMANAIYKKYGLTQVGSNKWGLSGHGFHDIRNYGNR